MNILGIETSCDETAASVVRDGYEVRSSVVYSQIARHQPFGGVVPEIASRCHVESLPGIIGRAMSDAQADWADLDGIAVTRGPGLATSLLVGLSAAKALALRLGKPLMGVNHLEAHLFSLFLDPKLVDRDSVFPMLILLVTGGHTCLFRVDGLGRYRLLGQTLDDAAGEALDKGASLLKLGYPGGPAIEKAAEGGRPDFFRFPRGLGHRGHADPSREYSFSFSGLKTALLYYLKDQPESPGSAHFADVVASYQEAVMEALLARVGKALERERVRSFGCVGGVSKNLRLREKLGRLAEKHRVGILLAPLEFCTDNAAMVAGLAGARRSWLSSAESQALDAAPDLQIA